MNRVLCLLLLPVLAGAAAADPDAGAAADDPATILRAENKTLRATVERQRKEIQKLEVRLDELMQRMKRLGITSDDLEAADQPATRPASRPADGDASKKLARRVVFAIDASGSMVNALGPVKVEVLKAVGGMAPAQSFNVVFFQDEKAVSFDRAPVPATKANLRKLAAFLDTVTTTGTTNPIPAIEQAMRQRPEVLWLATDGDFPDNRAVRQAIRKLNTWQCQVNTLLVVPPGVSATDSFVTAMWGIAQENGGRCYDLAGRPVQRPRTPAPVADTTASPPRGREPAKPLPTGRSIFDLDQ